MCNHPDAENYPEYTSFETALDEIGRLGHEEQIVFVIDEYPYLAKADIGSCKFKNEKIGIDELELIEHYVQVFGKGKTYHYVIFSLIATPIVRKKHIPRKHKNSPAGYDPRCLE